MSARAWLLECSRRLARVRRAMRARAELRAMNDLELRDLGLGRSDIDAVLADRFDEPAMPRFRPASRLPH